jgi:hypothetical protein
MKARNYAKSSAVAKTEIGLLADPWTFDSEFAPRKPGGLQLQADFVLLHTIVPVSLDTCLPTKPVARRKLDRH